MAPRKMFERTERSSLLVVVEGETEQAFCLYLKSELCRKSNQHVLVVNAHGGSPASIIRTAYKYFRQAAYDHVVIIFDTDRPLDGSSGSEAKMLLKKMRSKRGAPEIIKFSPCIEGFFLQLLKHYVPDDTAACKRCFREHCLDDEDKLEARSYAKIIPRQNFAALCCDPQFMRLYQLFANER
jgi:hypothetical protein